MKKTIPLFIILVATAVFLSGCSSKSAPSANGLNSNNPATKDGNQRKGRMPDFGQPDRTADLRGVVTTIVGNEVTVLKIAANQGRRASSTPESNNASGTETAPTLSLDGSGANRMRGGQGGFAGPSDGPNGGPGASGSGTTDRAAMLTSLKAMSTGQEKIIVPVGIKMMKSESDSAGKRTMIEASLTDITADKMITVWLNTSVADKKIADFILIN